MAAVWAIVVAAVKVMALVAHCCTLFQFVWGCSVGPVLRRRFAAEFVEMALNTFYSEIVAESAEEYTFTMEIKAGLV